MLNPTAQYADDSNFRARQRLWQNQEVETDLVGWVLGLAGLDAPAPGVSVLDVGCGNGAYLARLHDRGVVAVGCDLSYGMLRAVDRPGSLVNADVEALPVQDGAADVVLAPHMLYHVPDREAAVRELRRATRPDGLCVVVTNGPEHMEGLWSVVDAAIRRRAPGWERQSPGTHAFTTDNGAAQLGVAFDSVELERPPEVAVARIDDAAIVADYLASLADLVQPLIDHPWPEVVGDVRDVVADVVAAEGTFTVTADAGAFVCR